MSTYSDRLKLELMATGANVNTWGNVTNTNLETVDAFNAGYLAKSVAGSANVTLTTANRDPNAESSNKVIEFTGALTGDITVFIPAVENNYIFFNNTSGSFTLTVAPTGHGSNGVAISQGSHTVQYCTGDTVVDLFANSLGNVRVINQLRVGDNIQLNSNGVVAATTVTGNGAGLSGVNEFPSGTKVMFAQADAPTGFTKDTTAALNNSTLRIVTGSGGGTSGTSDFTSTFAAKSAAADTTVDMSPLTAPVSGTSGSHTLSTPELPAHNHSLRLNAPTPPAIRRVITAQPSSLSGTGGTTNFGNTGGGGSHSHPITGTVVGNNAADLTISQSVPNMDLKYLDSIIASQD